MKLQKTIKNETVITGKGLFGAFKHLLAKGPVVLDLAHVIGKRGLIFGTGDIDPLLGEPYRAFPI